MLVVVVRYLALVMAAAVLLLCTAKIAHTDGKVVLHKQSKGEDYLRTGVLQETVKQNPADLMYFPTKHS